MKHNLKISLAQRPDTGGIVRCKTVSLRERVLRRLFGDTRRITIIVPGDSVQALSLQSGSRPKGAAICCAGIRTFEYGCIGIKTAEMNTFAGDFPAVFSCAKFY